MRVDRIKLYENLKPLIDQGIETDTVFLAIPDENPYLYFIDETGERGNDFNFQAFLSVNQLESAVNGELESYEIINRFSLKKFLLYIALQWL